jgi:uncharacterized protein YjbI with pentapeptide repeats
MFCSLPGQIVQKTCQADWADLARQTGRTWPGGAAWDGLSMAGSMLVGSVLAGSILVGSILVGSILAGSILAGSILAGSILAGSILAGSMLKRQTRSYAKLPTMPNCPTYPCPSYRW